MNGHNVSELRYCFAESLRIPENGKSLMETGTKNEQFLAWLTYLPSLECVTRALVLDYLSLFKPAQASIYHLKKDDSLTRLANYGAKESRVEESIPSSSWRVASDGSPSNSGTSTANAMIWSDEDRQVMIKIHAQGMLIGFLVLNFVNPIADSDQFAAETLELFRCISLYIACRFLEKLEAGEALAEAANHASDRKKIDIPSFSKRQMTILLGMAKKKTNNSLAREIGYSVSTIRHEVSRIFEELEVSDRQEAVVKANSLGLL